MARKIPTVLTSLIRAQLLRAASPALSPITEAIKERYPESLTAIFYYGSCLQKGDPYQGIVDLFVIVDDYERCYKSRIAALTNRLLPPNVFYLETKGDKGTLRAKYAVISLKQLKKAVGPDWFHPFFWARFAQPMALSFTKNDSLIDQCSLICAEALLTFMQKIIPCMEGTFSVKELWKFGLSLTYGAELRPEGPERFNKLWHDSGPYFKMVTPIALSALPFLVRRTHFGDSDPSFYADIPQTERRRCRIAWNVRIFIGKPLSIARLIKAAFTFSGGVDYALWKIERHTGQKIQIGTFLRRHPIIAMAVLSWRLLRSKAIR